MAGTHVKSLKREARILLHVRQGSFDFIAVIRGSMGIEHLKILSSHTEIEDLAMIAGEKFFGEVKYLVTYPRDLYNRWREALKLIGRDDIILEPKLTKDLEDLIASYIDLFGKIAITLASLTSTQY
ncbi:MAG: hypothetical protein QXQ57_00960 [Sulfolobales archaeon]